MNSIKLRKKFRVLENIYVGKLMTSFDDLGESGEKNEFLNII
jgi:hypothetical protein